MSQKSFRMIDIGSKHFQFISVLNVTNNYLGTYLVYIFSYFFSHFRLSYYPHRLEAFTTLLKSVFGDKSKHSVYGDFKPLEQEPDPAFFIHVIEKQ